MRACVREVCVCMRERMCVNICPFYFLVGGRIGFKLGLEFYPLFCGNDLRSLSNSNKKKTGAGAAKDSAKDSAKGSGKVRTHNAHNKMPLPASGQNV